MYYLPENELQIMRRSSFQVAAWVCTCLASSFLNANAFHKSATSDNDRHDSLLTEDFWVSLRQKAVRFVLAPQPGTSGASFLSTDTAATNAIATLDGAGGVSVETAVGKGTEVSASDANDTQAPFSINQPVWSRIQGEAPVIEDQTSGDLCAGTCKWWERCTKVEVCTFEDGCANQSKCLIKPWFAAIGFIFILCPAMCRLLHVMLFSATFGYFHIPRFLWPTSAEDRPTATGLLVDQAVLKFATPPADARVIDTKTTIAAHGEEVGEKSEKDSTCTICLCDFQVGTRIRILPCGHRFHISCIDGWLSQSGTCPMCKHEIRDESRSCVKSVSEGDRGQ